MESFGILNLVSTKTWLDMGQRPCQLHLLPHQPVIHFDCLYGSGWWSNQPLSPLHATCTADISQRPASAKYTIYMLRSSSPPSQLHLSKRERERERERMTGLKIYVDRMSQPSRAIIIFCKYVICIVFAFLSFFDVFDEFLVFGLLLTVDSLNEKKKGKQDRIRGNQNRPFKGSAPFHSIQR